MKIAIVMNELEELTPEMDTTLLVIRECNLRKHEVAFVTPATLLLKNGIALGYFRKIDYQGGKISTVSDGLRELNTFDIILMRLDPPVNANYHSVCQILSFVSKPIINDPKFIMAFSEKLIPSLFPETGPITYLVRTYEQMEEILHNSPIKDYVIKPTDMHGGRLVFKINYDDDQRNKYFNLCSEGQSKHVILQQYCDVKQHGDKRVFVCGTEIIGVIKRIPPENEFRANIHLGATVETSDLNTAEFSRISKIAGYLCQHSVYWSAFDLIDGFVTEVNITSPSGIPEINKFAGTRAESKLVDFIEQYKP